MLVGCYGPSIAPGAPCEPAVNNCPHGQACQLEGAEYVCLPTGTARDAAVDAEPDAGSTDIDGDGILNDVDNCPTVANPNQHDEEEDSVGDVCDPCPVTADNNDSDGDGVGDGCDPRPDLAGDAFVVFEPFAQTLPAGWTMMNGTWSVGNDELRVVSSAGTVSSVRTNTPATSRMIAATSVVPDQVFGPVASVGIVLPYASALGGGGIQCSLLQSGMNRFLSLFDLGPDTAIDNDAFAWTANANYVLLAARDGTSYQCGGYSDSMMQAATGTSPTIIPNPTIGVRSEGTTARFQWLMIISMP